MAAFGTGRALLVAAAAALAAQLAAAQDIPLNYERLSSMEEPLATEIGDVTLTLTGLLDAPLAFDAEDDEFEAGLVGNFEFGALTQLPNRWRVSLAYFGQLATDPRFGSAPDDRYTDNAALSVGGMWGTLSGGNVSGVVREGTRRGRGAGNAALALDDVLGGLADWGGGYTGRFGPWVVGAVVDQDGNFDIGATFRRPLDNTDYRLSMRLSKGVYAPAGGSRGFDSRAVGAVGEVISGSTTFDLGLGYERLSSRGPDAGRWYASAGARGKAGALGWSVEAHSGRIAGAAELSAALGLRYDIARGLSANLGLNHARAKADAGGERLVDIEDTTILLSARYSF